jgi:adenine-specific DNA methylase
MVPQYIFLKLSNLVFQEEILNEVTNVDESFDFTLVKYIGLSIGVILLILIFIALYYLSKFVIKIDDSISVLKKEMDALKLENNRAYNTIDHKIKEFIKKNESTNPVKNTSQPNVQEEPSQPITLEIKKEALSEETEQVSMFYFKTPYEDNKFLITDGKIAPNEKTIYCITNDTLKLQENINTETMNSAINSMDLVIKTACLPLNSKEHNHSKIVMIEPGKVIKEGEDYRILEKIKVKFQ